MARTDATPRRGRLDRAGRRAGDRGSAASRPRRGAPPGYRHRRDRRWAAARPWPRGPRHQPVHRQARAVATATITVPPGGTSSMFNISSIRLADAGIDPKSAVRSARDLSLPDPGEFLRRVDVPAHVDAAMEAHVRRCTRRHRAAPRQRRRRPRLPILLARVAMPLASSRRSASRPRGSSNHAAAGDPAHVSREDRDFDGSGARSRRRRGRVDTSPAGTSRCPAPNGEVRELSGRRRPGLKCTAPLAPGVHPTPDAETHERGAAT